VLLDAIAVARGRAPARSPVRAAGCGVAAGIVATLAMDLVWYARYRRGGGQGAFPSWEVTSDLESWDQAPAPGQVARKLIEGTSGQEVPVERAALISNVMHWAYGTAWTTVYAVASTRLIGRRRWWQGPAFGALVWSSDYVSLPLLRVYEPIWRYDVPTLWKDFNAHLVFGTTAEGSLRALLARLG
jgi:hypothetical protein